MSLKDRYKIESIPKTECYEWILKKHYARRIPLIIYSFGIFDKFNILQGVCTFGNPARMLNNGYGCFDSLAVPGYELNRLVINENLDKNILSFFVSGCIQQIPENPCFIVSYADSNMGHHGFIYQATNFLYTGKTSDTIKYIDKLTGKEVHHRSLNSRLGTVEKSTLPENIEILNQETKHRYFYFKGDKKQVKEMKLKFRYKILPYPKGENKRYDAGYQPTIQGLLF